MPSLYDSTANTGEVSSSNFTTLYNASGLQVPNAGAGSITGNLNVGGNLTVQGTSLLIGDVTLQSTLSLPNYTFPAPDGTTDQVLVTDGNGNLYWSDVSAIPGADYNISATTATGGANLTLGNTAGFTDSVKFASGTNINIVRTDANTITISTTADDIPNGTARGQVLYWNGSAWTANNVISSAAAGDRLTAVYENSSAGSNSALFVRKNFGATNYGSANDGVGINFSVDSDSQALASYGVVNFEYSATDPQLSVNSSTDNFVSNSIPILTVDKTSVNVYAPTIILNATQSGVPSLNAVIQAERGSSTNATLTWNEATDTWDFNNSLTVGGVYSQTGESMTINSDSTAADSFLYLKGSTQYLKWNNTTSQFELSNSTTINGNATVLGNYSQTGESMTINSDSTAADSYLYMKGSTEYLKWDNTNTRFELSDQLYITQDEIPALFERRTLSTNLSPFEQKAGIKLLNRVTDSTNNDTTITGPCVAFARTSGASGGAERTFANMGSAWDGTTGTANLTFNWSNDNFSEPTPGNFPGSYVLLNLDSDYSRFYNDSVYIDYSQPGNQSIASSIITSNTLVFSTAHGFSVGDRIKYMSTTQNGLTQYSFYYVLSAGFTTTQCQLGLTSTSAPVALTNGTGLLLAFAELTNQVGINTSDPAYTLDVNGDMLVRTDATVLRDLAVLGDITVSGVKVDLGTPVHQGQFLYVSNDTTPTITNSNTIIAADGSYRPIFQYDNSTAGSTATMFLRKNFGATSYTTGDGTHIGFRVDSNSQAEQTLANIGATYDATTPQIFLETNANANTSGPFVRVATFTSTTANIGGTNLVLDYNNNGAAQNSVITANRGSSGTDATITWDESNNFWSFNNDVYSTGTVIGGVALATNGNNIYFNNEDGTAADCNIVVKRPGVGDPTIRWNETTDRWTTTVDGSTYLNIPNQNLDTTDSVTFSDVSVDGIATFNSQTTTTTSTSVATVASTAKLTLKAIINVIDNVTGEMQVLEALAFRKGTAAYLTTYGEMYTGVAALATFTAIGTGGLTSIQATPLSTNSTTFTVARISLD